MAVTQHIAVLEQQPVWRPGLVRELNSDAVDVHRCEAARQLLDWPGSWPLSVLVWEVSADTAAMLSLLTEQQELRPPAIVALATPEEAELEWTLRSVGVVCWLDVTTSPSELALPCRHLLRRLFREGTS